jgi:hypothetical protein
MQKLEFTLKQHTPLIHFQHDQAGATLRATEVKPKLDKFIIEKLGGWEKIPLDWRIEKQNTQHEALDYRVKIIIPPSAKLLWYSEDDPRFSFPCFFANMGDENIGKYRLCCCDSPIKLEIISLNTSLGEEIVNHICSFFSINTFGTRQSKGFGFFYPLKASPAFKNNTCYKEPNATYSFNIELINDDDLWNVKKYAFEYIDLFYRLLRSGLNRKRGPQFISKLLNGINEQISDRDTLFYCKPVIFQYLKSNTVQWDKKTIKEFFFDKDYYQRWKLDRNERELLDRRGIKVKSVLEYGLPLQIAKHVESDVLLFNSTKPHYLWRDLFGLSTDESWKSYSMNIVKTNAKQKGENWVPKLNTESSKITRFKSPIQFIPFFAEDGKSCRVFFYCKNIPREYRNATFLVSDGTSSIPLKIGNWNSIEPLIDWLLIPGNFDLKKNWYGLQNCIEFEKLKQVLTTLKKAK